MRLSRQRSRRPRHGPVEPKARQPHPSSPASRFPVKPVLALLILSMLLLLGLLAWEAFHKKEEAAPVPWRVQPPAQPAPPLAPKANVRGNPRAGVIVVEWGDFYCPWTRNVESAVRELLREYGDRVSLTWRHFPLDTACNPLLTQQVHAGACLAAEAAECAREQGAFWNYHDALLAERPLNASGLVALASHIGLDADNFSACLASGRMRSVIEKDVMDGIVLGINSTPTIFINERFFDAAYPYFIFKAAVEAELAGG
ncbi:MAG: thioredoxin domain-containing protein [Candidatus Micrarchaeia archaeon]